MFGNRRAQFTLGTRRNPSANGHGGKSRAVHTNAVLWESITAKIERVVCTDVGATSRQNGKGTSSHINVTGEKRRLLRLDGSFIFLATHSFVFSIDKCKTVDAMIMSAHVPKVLCCPSTAS